jgi:hypothetical protein
VEEQHTHTPRSTSHQMPRTPHHTTRTHHTTLRASTWLGSNVHRWKPANKGFPGVDRSGRPQLVGVLAVLLDAKLTGSSMVSFPLLTRRTCNAQRRYRTLLCAAIPYFCAHTHIHTHTCIRTSTPASTPAGIHTYAHTREQIRTRAQTQEAYTK